MKLNESITGISPPGLVRADGKKIEAYKNDDGDVIVTGGPFQRTKKNLGPIGSLDDPADQEMVQRWMDATGEDEDGQVGQEPTPLTREELMAVEAVAYLDQQLPGTGAGAALQWIANNLGDMLGQPGRSFFNDIFSEKRNQGGLMYRLKKTIAAGIPLRTEIDQETGRIKPVFSGKADNVDVGRALGNIVKLMQHSKNLRLMPNGPGKAAFLKTVMDMFHVVRTSSGSKIFIKTFPDDVAEYGVSLNLSQNHPITRAMEMIRKMTLDMEEELRKSGDIGEDEAPYLQDLQFEGFGKGSGLNLNDIRKNVSEEEVAIVHDIMTGNRQAAVTKAMALYRKYEEGIQDAMKYDDTCMDMCGVYLDEFRMMVGDQGKTAQEGILNLIGSMLKRRQALLQRFKPDNIIRVGEGGAETGYKPDILFVYNEKPTGELEEYAYEKDGKWYVGVSLKTYNKDESAGQKVGETYGLRKASEDILSNSKHWTSVASQIGMKPAQTRLVAEAAQEMKQVADFCISMKKTKFNGLDSTKSNKIIAEQVSRTLDSMGAKIPGLSKDELMKAIEFAKDGGKAGEAAFMTKLGNRLEKIMMQKMIDGAMRPDGTLDPKHPHALLQIAMLGNTGMDSSNGADSVSGRKPVLNATAFLEGKQESINYNANEDLSGKLQAALSGELPMRWTSDKKGGISIGDCARLNLEGGSNRNIVNAYSSHTRRC